MNRYKYSQYRNRRPTKTEDTPTQHPSSIEQRQLDVGDMWKSFQEGWQHQDFSTTDWEVWDNQHLTFDQFQEKYPGTTAEDYHNFKQNIPKPKWNWIQRAFLPRSIRNKLRGKMK